MRGAGAQGGADHDLGDVGAYAEEATVEGRAACPAKLFIGGITRNTTTKTLHDHFAAFGAVLDCVAMKMSDGRPRGFGYVTLDSAAAADRVLAEPQVIDGRVVDMKRAVPEAQGSGSKTSAPQSAGAVPRKDVGEPMRIPSSACYSWMDPLSQYPAYPTTPLMSTMPAAPPGEFILSTPVTADSRKQSILGTDACRIKEAGLAAPTLSACAPVFVPQVLPDGQIIDKMVEELLSGGSSKQEGAADNEAKIDNGECDDEVQKIMAYSVLPGLPPIQATALPAPLSLPSNYTPLEHGFASVPTSLPPGLDLWQPDEEVSPVCAEHYTFSTASTPHSLGQPSPTASGLVLSTVPRPQQSETPVVAKAADIAVKDCVEISLTSPANESVMKVALPSDQAEPKMCTIGTQTEILSEFVCSKCQAIERSTLASKRMAAQGGA